MTQNNDLIIFEENLTAEGLKKIAEEAKNFPTVAETKEDYNLVLEHHKRFKRLHVAVRGRADELIKIKKTDFQLAKTKISNDLNIVLGIIEPIRDNLALARENWDDKIKEEKRKKAKIEAKRQQEEMERQQKIQDEFYAYDMNKLFDDKAALKAQQEKLDREKYEFECEKSRLSFDDAWLEAEESEITLTECDQQHEIEKENYEPITGGFDPFGIDGLPVAGDEDLTASYKKDVQRPFVDDDLPIAPDLQKVADKMDKQGDRLKKLIISTKNLCFDVESELMTGFESQKITDHLYTFNQQLISFIDHFPEFDKKD